MNVKELEERAIAMMNAKLEFIALINTTEHLTEEQQNAFFHDMEDVRQFTEALFNKSIGLDEKAGYYYADEEPSEEALN